MSAYSKKKRRLEAALLNNLDMVAVRRALATITPEELMQMVADDLLGPIAAVDRVRAALESGGEEEAREHLRESGEWAPPVTH